MVVAFLFICAIEVCFAVPRKTQSEHSRIPFALDSTCANDQAALAIDIRKTVWRASSEVLGSTA